VLARNVNERVEPLSTAVTDAAADFRTLLAQAGERIAAAEQSLSAALGEYKKLAENANTQIEPLATSIRSAAEEADAALAQSREMLVELQRVVSRDSELHFRLVAALQELSSAARSVKVLADSLERQPESLLRGKIGFGER
jgi:paraquat-inducible protein B